MLPLSPTNLRCIWSCCQKWAEDPVVRQIVIAVPTREGNVDANPAMGRMVTEAVDQHYSPYHLVRGWGAKYAPNNILRNDSQSVLMLINADKFTY